MKTTFKRNLQGITGLQDGMVYCYYKKTGQIYARKHTKPKHNPTAQRLKLVMANIKQLNPSPAYRQNLNDYLDKYLKKFSHTDEVVFNWTGIFLKILYRMAKANPEIDLTTLTREQIYAQNLPCISLKDAVQAELLPIVPNWSKYDALI